MKKFKPLVIFLIIIIAIIFISYIAYDGETNPALSNNIANQNVAQNLIGSTNNENNQTESISGNTSNTSQNENNNNNENTSEKNEQENVENTKTEDQEEYVGKEEQDSQEGNNQDDTETQELTGEEKAVDIVKKKYARSGETVRFDHMEAGDYVVKINNGTAVTWYIVNGQTWEAEEY